MAWNRKGVTYVVTDDPYYDLDGDFMVVDRYVAPEPMAGFRSSDLIEAGVFARDCTSCFVSIFEETRTFHGGYMARLLWQEVRDE